jgi:peptidoglycan-N-acetylglucosamine deacetylase
MAAAVGAAVWVASPVTAATAQPAFYTYQAPGGAATLGQRVIALTFDDGPGPYTPAVLSVLQRFHVPATFFEIGDEVTAYPQYTRLLAASGYPVENHTWSHPDLTTLPIADFPGQIDRTQAEIASLTGQRPTCVRPPYNAFDQTVLQQVAQRGLTTMSYSVDPRDWSEPGTQAIVSRVVNSAVPGAVVDLHDGGGTRQQTVDALPQMITQLEGKGYRFVSICGTTSPVVPQASVVYSFGRAPAPGPSVTSAAPLVGDAADPTGGGYWLASGAGAVFSFGSAGYWGAPANLPLADPVVGLAATPSGRGYWLVARDGGVFSYGDAHFYGSTGGTKLAQPVVGMSSDPATGGYWLLSADGGVFSFHAPFLGSAFGAVPPGRFFAMAVTSTGQGYLLAGTRPA